MEIIRRLRQVITTKYARHKLANNGARFGAGSAIVTPNVIKAELINQYGVMEAAGLVENMAAFKANLIVERNLDDPNRLDVLFAPDLINQLRVFALLAQFRLQYPTAA
jgi:phage tail sheath gpL-like